MGLWEWFGERWNPGPTGKLDIQRSEFGEEDLSRSKQVIFFILGILFWILACRLIFFPFESRHIVVGLLFLILYLCLSYILHPEPRTDNLGFAGGLINNPFRWSDNFNRDLLFLQLFFLFGKLMIVSVLIARCWLRKK